MNHHTRSYSEQPQLAPQVATNNGQENSGPAQPQSFIRIHSDSQQSLDQLFNPTLASAVPLRNRNLPSSFFNPSLRLDEAMDTAAATNGNNHIQGNNFHSRSISFDQRNPNIAQTHRPNFHLRTHSTLAPMPRLDSNHSSHQSSREFLNNPDATGNNTSNNITNVSSCQQHSENIVSSTSTNNHNHLHQQHRHHHQSHSNGWSSAGNSADDSSSSSWPASQQEHPTVAHQPMQVVQHHQPTIMHEHSVQLQPNHSAHHHQQMASNIGPNHQAVFYSASQQTAAAVDSTTTPVAAGHVCQNHHSLHSRSVSYQQRPAPAVAEMRVNHGFHMRTHSTIAPLASTCHHHQPQVTSHHSSHQSSQEVLNHSSATSSSAAAGWSSSGYSTDDMTSAGVGQTWTGGDQHSHHQQQPGHITQQPLPQPPSMDHQATPLTALSGHHHHHHHIPMQVQQQPAHPMATQQVFYNF